MIVLLSFIGGVWGFCIFKAVCRWQRDRYYITQIEKVLQERPVRKTGHIDWRKAIFWILGGMILGKIIFPDDPILFLGLGGLGCAVPFLSWWKMEKSHAQKMSHQIPDFLELLALGLSAGLGFEEAWAQVIRYLAPGPLRDEMVSIFQTFRAGRNREACILEWGDSVKDERFKTLGQLIVHGLKQGTALETILLNEAILRRQEILIALERRAQTASIRLLFPLIFFIFPALFIVILGPLLIQISMHGFLF